MLAETLDDLLGEAAAERASERLTRGWDAAVGKPRYGPATDAVLAMLAELERLDADGVAALAASGGRDRLGEMPWPAAASPDEDDALRVSSELASADAAAVLAGSPIGARRAAARIGHLLALRHAFPTAGFERHAAPWLGGLIPDRRPSAPPGPPPALTTGSSSREARRFAGRASTGPPPSGLATSRRPPPGRRAVRCSG